MKKNNLKLILLMLPATICMVLFNNLDFVNWNTVDNVAPESTTETVRVAHAKEILGRQYYGSNAQKYKGLKKIHKAIHKNVHMNLSKKWKGYTRRIAHTVINESAKYELDPVFVLAVIKTESEFNPRIVGGVGEIGLMQVKPDTAEWIAKKYKINYKGGKKNLFKPEINIKIGTAYMHYLRSQFKGKVNKYVSAYNMGPKNVRRLLSQQKKPAIYKEKVMKNYALIYSVITTPESIAKVVMN